MQNVQSLPKPKIGTQSSAFEIYTNYIELVIETYDQLMVKKLEDGVVYVLLKVEGEGDDVFQISIEFLSKQYQ